MAHRLFSLFFGSLSVTVLLFLLAVSGQAQKMQSDPLGTVRAGKTACPNTGLAGTACYILDVSCSRIQDYVVYLKTFAPTNPPIGVVTLTNGGTSTALYEDYTYGSVTIQNLVAAGFLAIEITFGNHFSATEGGWQTNAYGAGVRAASCRYATVTAWIKNNLASQIPLCATGISAGSQQIAEGLAHYGLSQYLAFAELGSGPPFNRTDEACIPRNGRSVEYCSGADRGFGVDPTDSRRYIDPAYPGAWCSHDTETGSADHQQQFLEDSVTSPDAVLSYPGTKVWFLYGGKDDSTAVNQGENYRLQITTTNRAGCVPEAPHLIPDALAGAQQIASDTIGQCTAGRASK